jgi:hypothetical protein
MVIAFERVANMFLDEAKSALEKHDYSLALVNLREAQQRYGDLLGMDILQRENRR